jgi:pimeloyl-ACP methyl ester carboxylesterase
MSVDQFTTLFFEPADEGSQTAARRSYDRLAARTTGRSPEVPAEWAIAQIGTIPKNPVFPSPDVLRALHRTTVPVLHIGADHDIIFPVENWYALNAQLPTLTLITYPRAGHAPHHQYPAAAAAQIAGFIRGTRRTAANDSRQSGTLEVV